MDNFAQKAIIALIERWIITIFDAQGIVYLTARRVK